MFANQTNKKLSLQVMIANRRSKLQMRSELSLFLGGHTDKFTDWLHAVLEKLEAYTASCNSSDKEKDSSVVIKQEAGTISKPTTSLVSPQLSDRTEILEKVGTTNLETSKTAELSKSIHHHTDTMESDQYVPMPVTKGPGVSILLKADSLPEEIDDDCLNIREELQLIEEYQPEDTSSKKRNTSRSIYKVGVHNIMVLF